ncbi:SSI family serine proteinase inhibitor [Streptomyces sp. NPDC126503]|uniref:SSI family serine proteinase inhibitor n=1 Tax=Streptomyces sp. NPDC126503 TaxID=3155315 RepID=UPI00331F4BE5
MLRSLVLATLATSAVGAAGLGPLPLPLLAPAADSLTVTVSNSGHPEADGKYDLTCESKGGKGGKATIKAGGNHPAAQNACERLDHLARQGGDPFATVPENRFCTQVYGGSATAHVTGTWRGRSVDARFSRADGCEIDRWRNLEPVLPAVRG